MTRNELAKAIDHTILKAQATSDQVRKLCDEARQYGFASVCGNATHTALCARLLKGTGVDVCVVIGFPLGATTAETKAFETKHAIELGASEVDMVLNIGALKSGEDDTVLSDIRAVVTAADGRLVKVIIETCYLGNDEKRKACELAMAAGAHFVKTSTGFGPAGATVEDVKLMKSVVGDALQIKAAGGIKSFDDAFKMLKAGASRLGTSSGVQIMEEFTA